MSSFKFWLFASSSLDRSRKDLWSTFQQLQIEIEKSLITISVISDQSTEDLWSTFQQTPDRGREDLWLTFQQVQIEVEKTFDRHYSSPDWSREDIWSIFQQLQIEVEKIFDWHFSSPDWSREALRSQKTPERGREALWSYTAPVSRLKSPLITFLQFQGREAL